jgi:Chaperone of endosialidase
MNKFMKTNSIFIAICCLLSDISGLAFAQGTAFNYQGRLNDGGVPAEGYYDLQFVLFATNQFGFSAAILTNAAVPVNNGLFTTTLDFGGGVFTGTNYWLDILVRTNGAASFIELSPRQPITPVPYAVMAEGVNGPGLSVQQNTNGAPNVIGGSPNNFVSSGLVGATIGGGGAVIYNGSHYTNKVTGSFGTVGGGAGNAASAFDTVSGGYQNTATSGYSTVGGGFENIASDSFATVAGGEENIASVNDATVGGGDNNIAQGAYATVSGGENNTASGFSATVGGGSANTASGDDATVAGGNGNTAGGGYSFAAGQRAKANHVGAFVWADSQTADFASTANDQFLIRAQGGVGIGNNNPQAPLHITGGGDASLSGGGNIISGLVSGQNLVIDNNEIISRNNGAASDLILNFGSGNVGIGRTPTANRLEVGGDASKATAGSWLANSDARIKTDVQTVTNALDKLSRVRLVQFRYTGDYRAAHPGVEDREYLNVVAQEFQKVFPEDVKRSGEKLANGDDILQVDTYPLTIYSAAAVQELNQKLTGELKRRDAENVELRQRLDALEKIVMNLKSN